MTELAEFIEKPRIGKARTALFKRLISIVAMPTSSLPPSDRSMAGDILLDMLFHAEDQTRIECSTRLRNIREAPRRLLRYLGQCGIEIARPLLQDNEGYDASDLRQLVGLTTVEHHLIIASREEVPATVGDALVATDEPHVIRQLLANRGAILSEQALDRILICSRKHEDLTELLIQRPELEPSQAMVMFWWADGPTRRLILQKHAADRNEMIQRCAEVFPMMAEEGWSDEIARKGLQMIERRQRNRAAIEKSEFESLEDAVSHAAIVGMTPELATEIGYLAGVKPVTIAKILSDHGGEGLAVLCKATGLKRPYLRELWRALKRPLELTHGEPHPQFEYVSESYELLSVAKAQTTLRYWNWSLSSSYSQEMISGDLLSGEFANDEDHFSASQRTAQLVFGS